MLLKYNPGLCLPSAEDLPDSDDTPVDNELQDLIPGLLKILLASIWSERMDWFFGGLQVCPLRDTTHIRYKIILIGQSSIGDVPSRTQENRVHHNDFN